MTILCISQLAGFPVRYPNWCIPTYFCASGAFLTSLPAIVCDILTLKRLWSNPRLRVLGVPLVGAAFGLFLLGWVAFFNPLGTIGYRSEKIDGLFNPHRVAMARSIDLINQAELIGICKLFMDYGMQVSVAFGALSAVGVELYDRLKPHWITVPFAFAYPLVLPLVFIWTPDLRDVFDPNCFAAFLLYWLVSGSIAGVGITTIVWTVRDGWWDEWTEWDGWDWTLD